MTLRTLRLAAFALRMIRDSAPPLNAAAKAQFEEAVLEVEGEIQRAEEDLAGIERPHVRPEDGSVSEGKAE